MISFIIGFALGFFIAMRFAPKIKITNGKINIEWSDTKKNNTNP